MSVPEGDLNLIREQHALLQRVNGWATAYQQLMRLTPGHPRRAEWLLLTQDILDLVELCSLLHDMQHHAERHRLTMAAN